MNASLYRAQPPTDNTSHGTISQVRQITNHAHLKDDLDLSGRICIICMV